LNPDQIKVKFTFTAAALVRLGCRGVFFVGLKIEREKKIGGG
jgi:hypothetical protein